jgi:hypothetical protein
MIEFIMKWCNDNNILNRTVNMFWKCFETYSKEEPEEYKTVFPAGKKNVILKFDKVAYEIDLPNFSQELIAVTLNIYICESEVGWYKQLYLRNGEPFDEYFVIE